LYEGFPVAILEAMAAGLPVVTTRVSGNPEAVEHEKTGLLVDPLDVSGLAEALVRLLDDPAWARRLGNAGRRRIEAEFSIERIADDYLRLWQNLASDPGGRQITATHRGESASLSTRRDTR
ncbi:MAG: glycosyltransferase family 4 protein, partial [Acidobacteriota bacterium]